MPKDTLDDLVTRIASMRLSDAKKFEKIMMILKEIRGENKEEISRKRALFASYNNYMKQIKDFPSLTTEENKILARQLRMATGEDKDRIRQKMIEGNLKLAIKYVLNSDLLKDNPCYDINDIIQESNQILIESVDRYDPELGSFSNYFFISLRKINHSARLQYSACTIPSNVQYWLIKGNDITDEEVAKSCKIPPETYRKAKAVFNGSVSLEAEILIDDEEANLPVDLIDSYNLIEAVENNDLSTQLKNALATLPVQYRKIIEDYYGLNGEEKSAKQIGEQLDVSASWVHQVRNKALRKLRHPEKTRCYRNYYEE